LQQRKLGIKGLQQAKETRISEQGLAKKKTRKANAENQVGRPARNEASPHEAESSGGEKPKAKAMKRTAE
jgi:hypothetical protein